MNEIERFQHILENVNDSLKRIQEAGSYFLNGDKTESSNILHSENVKLSLVGKEIEYLINMTKPRKEYSQPKPKVICLEDSKGKVYD